METLQDLVRSLSSREFSPVIWRDGSEVHSLSSRELMERSLDVASGLFNLGVSSGDRVAVFSDNHHKWLSSVLGIDYGGVIDVPRGTDATDDELGYILDHSDPKVVLAQDQRQADRVKRLATPHRIITLDDSLEMSVEDLQGLGRENRRFFSPVDRDDVASIIYTSGTTGRPKGVMLSHGNYMANAHDLHRFLGDLSDDTFLHILPNWHAFGRGELHLGLIGGADTFHSSVRTLMRDAKEQSPSIIVSVPRLWESVYEKLMDKSSARFISKLPNQYLRRTFVGSAVNKALGGNIRLIVSGGGGLPYHIDSFFDRVGIEILEGYGLTETAPVISARPPGSKRSALGTVGTALDTVEVSVRDKRGFDLAHGREGVIHARGPNVMNGYYKEGHATEEVLGPDRYFNTGDIGFFNENGYLVVTGRADDRITLLNGENVNPAPIEEYLKTSTKYIKHAVVVGGQWDPSSNRVMPWKRLGALVVPHYENLKEKFRDISDQVSESDLVKHPGVRDFLEKQVRSLRGDFRSYEQVHAVVPVNEFSYGRELTATDKLRRLEIIRSLHADKVALLGQYLQ